MLVKTPDRTAVDTTIRHLRRDAQQSENGDDELVHSAQQQRRW
jgi:hypothetical protein